MGISDPKSRGAFGSSKNLKKLPSTGSGSVVILKKKESTPIPETQTAWVQNASYNLDGLTDVCIELPSDKFASPHRVQFHCRCAPKGNET